MANRGGDRFRTRRDFNSRPDESKSLRVNAPPSRHLWVGNLSHSIDERTLADQFYNFGELESVAFQPGRSYAFVNFKREDEAIAAMRELQGFPLAGMGLKIEFTKADRSSATSRGQDYPQRRDDQRAVRDSRGNDIIEPKFSDRSSMNDKDDEHCEVLWIGFPASLRVDETILRKAFAPFGEIEKITSFPGRSYAFVRYRDISAARRAKETLQGKLFGNPRVHICYSKSDSSSTHGGKSSSNLSPSPTTYLNYSAPPRIPLNHDERNFPGILGDPTMRSPSFLPNGEHGHPDAFGYNRDGSLWSTGNKALEKRKFSDMESDLCFSEDRYERRRSPIMERDPQFPRYSPRRDSKRSPLYEEPWDVPEEKYPFHGTKKSKPDPYSSEKELPEYPLSGFDYGKSRGSKGTFPDLSHPLPINRSSDTPGSFAYRQNSDHNFSLSTHQEGKNKLSYDSFQSVPGNLHPSSSGHNTFDSEPHLVSQKEWKWEGTIAKSGTPVCRALCFPVGKNMDNSLPNVLDCTARTGLEMLAKHFYSAADSWVVFFAPQTDADIGPYDEFMHYLAERQRAAVAKLDDLHTLFLVPPSEFSEKVLKVPGTLSISGLILRLDQPVINFGSTNTIDKNDASSMQYSGDPRTQRSISPPIPASGSLSGFGSSGVHNSRYPDNMPVSAAPLSLPPPPPLPIYSAATNTFGNNNNNNNGSGRQEYPLPHQRNLTPPPGWSDLVQHPAPASGGWNRPSNACNNTATQEHQHIQSNLQDWSSNQYNYSQQNSVSGGSGYPGQENKANLPSSFSLSSIPPVQLAQLASSLLGKHTDAAPNSSTTADFRQNNTSYQPENPYQMQQAGASNFTAHQFAQPQAQQFQQPQTLNVQQFQPQPQQQIPIIPPAPPTTQFEQQKGQQVPQTAPTQGGQADTDPQKRLQATLQLAAALLQQIQQGKAT